MENNTKVVYSQKIDCSAVFKKKEGRYVSSMQLFIGKMMIVEYFYDGSVGTVNPKKYKVNSLFIKLKDEFTKFSTEKECEETCIRIAKLFCEKLENK